MKTKFKRQSSPFLFLFFPNVDHYNHFNRFEGNRYIKSKLIKGITNTMCVMQALVTKILSKSSNIIVPRYRRRKSNDNLKIYGSRSKNTDCKYLGCITQLSMYISYARYSMNLTPMKAPNAMGWLYGSTLVYDKNKHKIRRTGFQQIGYTHYKETREWANI